jgi:hypothetical protein
MRTRAWFKATVYGIQVSQAGEGDEAQFHRSGWSKQEIAIVMARNGFIVDKVENYGGPGQRPDYCTPSMYVRALKPMSSMKVGWVGSPNMVAAQMRIRVHAIDNWLRSQGYYSKVINYDEAINFDIIIVGKSFSEEDTRRIKDLKDQGKTVVCDVCENLIGWPNVDQQLALCDSVVCCSTELQNLVKPVNSNVFVIEDAYEV